MRMKFWMAAMAAGFWGMGAALAQPIVIGVSTPKTGPLATASEWEMWGVDLALEEINAAGGLLGRKVEIMVLDNKCNPSEGVNVANKLVEAKVVAIEGAHCSSPHLATMKIVEADPVVRGQTAASSYKPAKLENGVRVMVPPHIENGARIVVNTADSSYVERARD